MPRENASLLERVLGGFRDAVDDIRTKLIDEGWFGRHLAAPSMAQRLGWSREDNPAGEAIDNVPPEFFTDEPLPDRDRTFAQRPSFEEMWRVYEHERPREIDREQGLLIEYQPGGEDLER